MLDAIVIGSGPNGLAAAITLAREGFSVTVYEAQPGIGGGTKTAELTLPGFRHDVCSAVHPLAVASPFFRSVPLEKHGLEWIYPPTAFAHPVDGQQAAVLQGSVDATAIGLGPDAAAYRRLFGPLAPYWDELSQQILSPLRWPRHPVAFARFGLGALMPAAPFARMLFRTERARALFGGVAAHAALPLDWLATSSVALVLMLAGHGQGWPIPRGGSQAIADAMASYLKLLGGTIVTSQRVEDLAQLPASRVLLFDLSPRQVLRIASKRFAANFRHALERFRLGPGVFKMDWALRAPIPWKDPDCARTATVHVGGSLAEMVESEAAPWRGEHAQRPYVLLAQPSLFDRTRAPEGQHTAWAYCHVPNGSTVDHTEAIEDQIERFAPGFRDVILARSTLTPPQMEAQNANLIGGDISGGAAMFSQLLLRPTARMWATPDPALFFCSSSTPPGPGVHGMCGFNAAQLALRRLRSRR
jgi:phytoene dehydrogenase-like protein